jgi:hypothetical protein
MLAKELQEELADLYDVDVTINRKDAGHIFLDFHYDLEKRGQLDENTVLRLRAFCDGYTRGREKHPSYPKGG